MVSNTFIDGDIVTEGGIALRMEMVKNGVKVLRKMMDKGEENDMYQFILKLITEYKQDILNYGNPDIKVTVVNYFTVIGQ